MPALTLLCAHVFLLFLNSLIILEPYPACWYQTGMLCPTQLWESHLKGTSAEQQIHFPAPRQEELSSCHPWQMFVPFKTTRGGDSAEFLALCSLHHLKVFPDISSETFLQFILTSTYPTNWKWRTGYRLSQCLFNVIQNLSSPLNFLFSSLSWTIPGCSVFACRSCFSHLIFLLSFGLSPTTLPVPWSVH